MSLNLFTLNTHKKITLHYFPALNLLSWLLYFIMNFQTCSLALSAKESQFWHWVMLRFLMILEKSLFHFFEVSLSFFIISSSSAIVIFSVAITLSEREFFVFQNTFLPVILSPLRILWYRCGIFSVVSLNNFFDLHTFSFLQLYPSGNCYRLLPYL